MNYNKSRKTIESLIDKTIIPENSIKRQPFFYSEIAPYIIEGEIIQTFEENLSPKNLETFEIPYNTDMKSFIPWIHKNPKFSLN